MVYKSSTVPIGGAPFIPPSLALQDAVYYGDNFSSASSSRSSSISSPSSSSPSETNLDSPQSSGRMSTSPSPSSSKQSDYPLSPRQAAAREYARSLHGHTASMWETERLNIERNKLESPGTPPRHKTRPASGGYIRPPSQPAPAAAAVEPPRSRAMDLLMRRSWGKKLSSGHTRGKSL